MMNALNAGTDYSQEQALQDFATGFIGDLAGGGLGELTSKYGAPAIAKGIAKMGFDYKTLCSMMGGGLKNISKSVDGITSTRMVQGWAKGKVAVIGRDQANRVDVFAAGLKKQGINAETFHWDDKLTPDQNFERNKEWVSKLKEQGYTIYDTGTGPISPNKGRDYGMETNEIFGD
jgi:hypothetical protein